jgi:hypothetical protein
MAMFRDLAFADAVLSAQHRADERWEVFGTASGHYWMKTLWTCTGVIDALTIALQAASVHGVAPMVARLKPAFAKRVRRAGRRSVARQSVAGALMTLRLHLCLCLCLCVAAQGGYMLCGSMWNEWHPFNPVVEQVRWLKGGLPRATRFVPLLVDLLHDGKQGVTTAAVRGVSVAGAVQLLQLRVCVCVHADNGLEYPYDSIVNSSFVYESLIKGARCHAAVIFVARGWVGRRHGTMGLRACVRACAEKKQQASNPRAVRGPRSRPIAAAYSAGSSSASLLDGDDDVMTAKRWWVVAEHPEAEMALLRHVLLRCWRSPLQKTNELLRDSHVRVVVVLCHAVPCRAVSCRVVSCRVVSCRAVPCRAVPCRAVPCRAVPCRAVPCREMTRRALCLRVLSCASAGCRVRGGHA